MQTHTRCMMILCYRGEDSLYSSAVGALHRPLESQPLTVLQIHVEVLCNPKQIKASTEMSRCDGKSPKYTHYLSEDPWRDQGGFHT